MLSEKAMLTLEANIPKLARNAFEKAYYDALTNSGRVLGSSQKTEFKAL